MTLRIDHQSAGETCRHCRADYPVSRGTVYDGEKPLAIYLAGMHGCGPGGSVVLAIALPPEGAKRPVAATIQVWATPDDYQMSILEPKMSPWKDHEYLGRPLTRDEVLLSRHKELIFEIADTIVASNPSIQEYFSDLDGGA